MNVEICIPQVQGGKLLMGKHTFQRVFDSQHVEWALHNAPVEQHGSHPTRLFRWEKITGVETFVLLPWTREIAYFASSSASSQNSYLHLR